MILSCSNISKAFGTEEILKHVSFHVEDHEKAAIVGINGAGKSTLLKIIVGELAADEGSVTIAKGKTLGYLAQHQDLHSQTTIYDSLLEVKRPILEMEQQIRTLELQMKHADSALSRKNFPNRFPNFQAVRKHASPSVSSCSPNRTSSFWTSRPTTSTWNPSRGWKPI